MVRVGELAFVYEDGSLTQYFYTIGDERAQRKATQEPDREVEPERSGLTKGVPRPRPAVLGLCRRRC